MSKTLEAVSNKATGEREEGGHRFRLIAGLEGVHIEIVEEVAAACISLSWNNRNMPRAGQSFFIHDSLVFLTIVCCLHC